jgi:hypothetical protein
MEEAINAIWKWLGGEPQSASYHDKLITELTEWVPDEPIGPTGFISACAQDFSISLLNAVRSLQAATPKEACLAAKFAYGAVFACALAIHKAETEQLMVNVPRILSEPCVQTELNRQDRDLTELESAFRANQMPNLEFFKQRSESEDAFSSVPFK